MRQQSWILPGPPFNYWIYGGERFQCPWRQLSGLQEKSHWMLATRFTDSLDWPDFIDLLLSNWSSSKIDKPTHWPSGLGCNGYGPELERNWWASIEHTARTTRRALLSVQYQDNMKLDWNCMGKQSGDWRWLCSCLWYLDLPPCTIALYLMTSKHLSILWLSRSNVHIMNTRVNEGHKERVLILEVLDQAFRAE